MVKLMLQEALLAVAAPGKVDEVLSAAVRSAGGDGVPGRGPALDGFLQRHLKPAIERIVSMQAARTVLREVLPVLGGGPPEGGAEVPNEDATPVRRDTLDRIRRESFLPLPVQKRISELPEDVRAELRERTSLGVQDSGHATVQSPEIGFPMVVIATASDARLRDLVEQLEGDAAVHAVADAVALLPVLSIGAELNPFVIIDWQEPIITRAALVELGPKLPEGTTLILWGMSPSEHEALRPAMPAGSRCVSIAATATVTEVAEFIITLVS